MRTEPVTEPGGDSRDSVLEVEPGAWNALLAQLGCGDSYLLREYLESACLIEPARPVFLHLGSAGGDVVFPCLVRELPGGRTDVKTPYGYGGPVAVGADPPAERFFERYERWCSENGVVSTFIRFHPLLANQRYAGRGMHVERLPGTISWRLDRGGDLFAAMHKHHRRVIRKAQAASVAAAVQAAPASLGDFVELYERTMRVRGASAFYLFPRAYWEFVASELRDSVVRVDAFVSDELVASVLALAARPWLHYHLGASSEHGRSVGANHLVLYEAARWGMEHGFSRFHLGGGVGGRRDSLFEFKRRFDPEGLTEAYLGKAVHDADAYRALSETREITFAGFFPAYRRSG